MKKILSVLKTGFYIVAILLLGQVPIAQKTVGGHVQHGLIQGMEWSIREFKNSGLYRALGEIPIFSSIFVSPKRPELVASKAPEPAAREINPADRANLLRMLE